MVIIMKTGHTPEQLREVEEGIKKLGLHFRTVPGQKDTTICVLGPTEKLTANHFFVYSGVHDVVRVNKPYKMAAKTFESQETTIQLKGHPPVGAKDFIVMAGPCSVESEEQTLRIARAVKASGATVLRGGAFKPRTSPYDFQGLGEEALKILAKARKETGLLVVSEAMDIENLEMVAHYVDIIQIGARNMQNYPLLKALGKINRPVLLKRGMSSTIDEWLLAAEYVLASGNEGVMLCERGIRSFDNKYARNTLDLNAVAIARQLTHLPVIVDPSHGTGHRPLVSPLALAAMPVGAQGIIVEVHDRPSEALSDGPQALLPSDFDLLMKKLIKMGKSLDVNVILNSAFKQKNAA